MYPPDPASIEMSSIGGNVACNSGGIRCVKYGVTADYVIGATVVLADGRVMRLGGKLRKRASGYRLLQLFVGSEGTLGIVTEVIVKLVPLPRSRRQARPSRAPWPPATFLPRSRSSTAARSSWCATSCRRASSRISKRC
jgi:FAD/FMN-containing dehydrogenase